MLLLMKLEIHIQSTLSRRTLLRDVTAFLYSLIDSIRRTPFSEGHLGPLSKVSVFEGVVDCIYIGKTYISGAREIL